MPPLRSYTELFHQQAAESIAYAPIGHIRSQYRERHGTPRQAVLVQQSASTEPDAELVLCGLVPGRALDALEGFEYAWLISDLHLNRVGNPNVKGGHWNPTVRPPPRMHRSPDCRPTGLNDSSTDGNTASHSQWQKPSRRAQRVGVLATRAPHRPNPIGLSAVRVLGVDCAAGTVKLQGVDLLDGTPILDIKPYVPYADAFPQAKSGWLEESS